jgi:hypothetical protein
MEIPKQPIAPVDEKMALAQVAEALRDMNKTLQLIHTELMDIKRAVNSLKPRP